MTSWAQYKAFASHGEKFNMAPVDVSGPHTQEPVKVVHEGEGTHGAGGGGDGGGALGQGRGADAKAGDVPSETRESDIVDGKPRDTIHSVTSAIRGSNPSNHHHLDVGDIPGASAFGYASAAVGATGGGPGGNISGPGGSGGGNAKTSGRDKSPHSPSMSTKARMGGDAEQGERKPSKADEAWQEWEKEEMEELLGEIRGHLGEFKFLEDEFP